MDHIYFMRKALAQAKQTLAIGEFPAAAILVGTDGIIASGARTGTIENRFNETDHAEMLALRNMNRIKASSPAGGLTAYCTLEPCLMCFGALLISGVTNIVYAYEDAMGGGTRCDLSRLPPLYQNMSFSIVPHILRADSLALFKTYFSNPQTVYLKKSFLAAYTLTQP
ncbi:MAG: nucleoside deaminase [Desulfobacterales bacterium]|nr:nucleoside deaminase [Desulfobacterales bacterium]